MSTFCQGLHGGIFTCKYILTESSQQCRVGGISMPILQMRKSETKRAQLSILWIVRSEFKVRSEPDLSYFKSGGGGGVLFFVVVFFLLYNNCSNTA